MKNPEHVPHIALGVIRAEDEVLLIERRKIEQGKDGETLTWAFPGGKFEPGETVWGAVAREVAEETGYQVVPIRELDARQHPSFPAYVHYVACHLENIERETVSDRGVQQVKWVRIAKLGLYVTSNLNSYVDAYLHD